MNPAVKPPVTGEKDMSERIAHRPHFEAVAVLEILMLVAAVAVFTQLRRSTSLAHAASNAQSKPEEIGFYCNLKALTTEERARHKHLTVQLKQATLETKELPDGYGFRLDSAKISLPDLAEWISAERKCCNFFDFELELQRNDGPLWLKLHGKDGVKAFMRQEFGVQ
jgi:hypothetical protein